MKQTKHFSNPKLDRRCLPLIAAVVFAALTPLLAATATGPLQVSTANPRYFADPSGKPVYLTGAHTWNTLQDIGISNPPSALDFDRYLEFLEKHHHNFVRLWRWELTSWTERHDKRARFCVPHPWERTGPGKALDGEEKFDLSKFDEAYFKRLRARVQAAGKCGIYVSIMLFENWGIQYEPNAWKAHPFNPDNNVNSLGEDLRQEDKRLELYSLDRPVVTKLQEAYVRKVIDTVNDLDNVLYEIANEAGLYSTKWQYHMIQLIRDYEQGKPERHPIGMTSDGFGGEDDTGRLFKSQADWISPSPDKDDYKGNPPAATGAKVIIPDTDHLWGLGGNPQWVWKSFMRGLNPIFMDSYERKVLDERQMTQEFQFGGSDAQWESIRRSLGDTRRFAERMDLRTVTPRLELASTIYCLANPGVEYLVYQPKSNEVFTVELKPGKYHCEWFNPANGTTVKSEQVEFSDRVQQFKAPFEGDAVLYLKAT